MLTSPKFTAFLPTINPEASKRYYTEVLGLNLISEDNYSLVFEQEDMLLRITVVQEFTPQPFTVFGFKIEDIIYQVKALTDKGILFERYGHFDQDEHGIWTAPSQAKIAWFKDPDGNLLSLTEFPK